MIRGPSDADLPSELRALTHLSGVDLLLADVYLRRAEELLPQVCMKEHGWRREESWTHLDGYQVTRERQLRALVGGHARFGGGPNLSALVRDYYSDRLTARLAILRR